MIRYIMVSLLLLQINAQRFSKIRDIPIENYETVGLQENIVDLELLPRTFAADSFENDPKEHFFRFQKSFDGDQLVSNVDQQLERYRNLPQPGGFSTSRNKRSTEIETKAKDVVSGLEKQLLGKPLELATLEAAEPTTKAAVETTTANSLLTKVPVERNLLINDFIRFKRESTTENMKTQGGVEDIETLNNTNDVNRAKRVRTLEGHSGKMLMDPNNLPQEGNREPRGATKEQWVKNVYPVRRSNDEDNSAASSETVRAPRVHFVTERRSETVPPPMYRSYDREARARNLNQELSRDLSRDMSREMDYYQPRYTRHYDPMPPRSQPRYRYDDNYYRFDSSRDLYDRTPDNYYSDRDRNLFGGSKQKRIIYYATLPDVSRTPPNVDLRDRYNYRERFDDRYVNSAAGDPYRFRKGYPKSMYEDSDRTKAAPYPQKVSTDVNVREIKKNPERRIYSEVDRSRSYGFKASPYLNDRN